jgi:hypothetical protein
MHPGSFFTIEREWQAGDVVRLELPFTLAVETWPRDGVSLTYGPLTLALPIPARAEIERENSTILQQESTLGAEYQPRPSAVREDFPAWNLYPDGPWNYALCVDADGLDAVTVEWNEACPDPLDAANPPLKARVKARRVRGWRMVRSRRIRQFNHWIIDGTFHRGKRTVPGDFQFTPPLPEPASLPARLSAETEEIELIPYAATLLRITVFPKG